MRNWIEAIRPGASAVAVAVALAACSSSGGYYKAQAEAECHSRGINPGTSAFADCVKQVEDEEYKRASDADAGE